MAPKSLRVITCAGLVMLLYMASSALAQTAPSLGSAQSFAVLGASTVTNTGSTVITGDVGVSPSSAVVGFPPGLINSGTIHAADAAALAAQNSATTAYNNLTSQPCTQDLTGVDLGAAPRLPGVYCFDSSAQLTGTLTLNTGGNPAAVFIFKIGSTLTTASASSVVVNGGSLCNVFWQVGSSATLGTTTSFAGNILALTSITLNTGASLTGRALARNGAVTLDTNTVNVGACSSGPLPPTPPPAPGPSPRPNACAATAPDLFIVKTHTNPFVTGTNATYSIAVGNNGITSIGPITVTDTLPATLTFVSAGGVSWSCAAAGQVVSCTSAASIPGSIALIVRPGFDAVPAVTNNALVSGGGDCDLTNNATADVAAVTLGPAIPVPTLSEWAMMMLAVLLAVAGGVALRRRTST